MTIVRNPFDLALRFNNYSVIAEGKNKSLRIIEVIELNKIGARAGKPQIFKAVAGDFKVKASPTQLLPVTSPVIPNVDLELGKFGDNDQLPKKELTPKVTILLALTTSSRISAPHILDLNHMINTSQYYEFRFHKLQKSWKRGESPPSLKIYAFPSDKALCVLQL